MENSNATLKIKKYLGNDIHVTIPSEYNSKKVTIIISECSFEWAKIKSIAIPRSVKKIGNLAFEYCYNLKKVICKIPKDKITWKWSDLKIDESIVEYD